MATQEAVDIWEAMPDGWVLRITHWRGGVAYRYRLGADHWYDVHKHADGLWWVSETYTTRRVSAGVGLPAINWKRDKNVFPHGFADQVAAAVAATLRGNTRGTT